MNQKIWHAEFRQEAKVVFVLDPALRPARYIKTHRCVIAVACPVCHARVGDPCTRSKGKAVQEVHLARKDVFYGRVVEEVRKETWKIHKKTS